MATHSSILAWRIPWTGEPGGLQSMGSQSQTQLKQLSTHTQRMSRLHIFFHLVIRGLVKTQEKVLCSMKKILCRVHHVKCWAG